MSNLLARATRFEIGFFLVWFFLEISEHSALLYGWGGRNFENPDFCKFVKTPSGNTYSFSFRWKIHKSTFYFMLKALLKEHLFVSKKLVKMYFSKKPTISKFFIDMTSQFGALSPFGSIFAEHNSGMTWKKKSREIKIFI